MPRFESSSNFEHGRSASIGVLLVNLGTPDAPTSSAVRRYLSDFLSDPRVVEVPRLIWWVILHGFILRFRPSRTAKAYQKVWTDNGSPLMLYSQEVTDALRKTLVAHSSAPIRVTIGMSYGNPSIDAALAELYAHNVEHIILLPMYPQYSSTTSGSVFEAVTRSLSKRRWVPEFRFINHFHDAPGYIAALAASIREHWSEHGRGERLLFSFHGLPQQMLPDGDPYHCQCQKTARLTADELELDKDDWTVSFQSRVGRDEWLRPYTDEVVTGWGKSGSGKIDVVCPGFSVDCLETLEEIAMRYAELYAENGGGELRYIAALNSREDHISFLRDLVLESVSDWTSSVAINSTDGGLEDSRRRAIEMGAGR